MRIQKKKRIKYRRKYIEEIFATRLHPSFLSLFVDYSILFVYSVFTTKENCYKKLWDGRCTVGHLLNPPSIPHIWYLFFTYIFLLISTMQSLLTHYVRIVFCMMTRFSDILKFTVNFVASRIHLWAIGFVMVFYLFL